jgi:EmrB/QacA subfamily drug resistance transporter
MANALRLGTAAGRGAVLASALASGMAFLDATVVNVALPHLGRELHATVSGLQWTVTGYALTLAAFVLLGGALGDRYGRRAVFLIGVSWFTLASVLCGLSTGVAVLVGARALQGCGAALLTPGSLALLQASFDERDRGRAIGLWSGLSGASTAVGPFVGGWLIDLLSWRAIFFLNVPLAALSLAATLRWVPESRGGGTDHRFDVAGAALGAVGLAGVTYALIQHEWWAGPVGLAGLLGFVLVERRRGDAAMLPPRLFGSLPFTLLNVVTFFVYAGVAAIAFFLTVEVQTVSGFSALVAGTTVLPLTLLMLLGAGRAGALGAQIGPRWPLSAGGLVAAAGLVLMLRIGPRASYLFDVLPATVVFGLGMTLLVAPLTTAVLAAAPGELAGVASGVNNATARAAGLLAVAALPVAVGLTGEQYAQSAAFDAAYHRAVWYCAGLYVLGALLALALPRGRPGRAAGPSAPSGGERRGGQPPVRTG